MSSGKLSERVEARAYRAFFTVLWQRFLHENFRDPVHVAHDFRVDVKTAQNWWTGTCAPQGWAVARAVSNPETAEQALADLSAAA